MFTSGTFISGRSEQQQNFTIRQRSAKELDATQDPNCSGISRGVQPLPITPFAPGNCKIAAGIPVSKEIWANAYA